MAGLAAGLAEVRSSLVVVMACDMPLLDRRVVSELVAAAAAAERFDGVLLVDDEGRRQPLAAAYRSDSLRTAINNLPTTRDAAVRALIAPLALVEMPAGPRATLDCDTWEAVARSRYLLEEA